MSFIFQRKKNERHPRKRSAKTLNRRRVKNKIYKSRGWKLDFPNLFKEIPDYPFIVNK